MKEAKAQAEESVNELKVERGIRDQFVATLSHDLRTPLTAAKMSAQLISRKLVDPAFQKISFRISDLMDRSDRMIRDLLDANMIKVGQTLPMKMSEADLVEVTKDTIEELSGIHGDRFRLIEAGAIVGLWDIDAVRRILENLLGNAVKYGSMNTEIVVSLRAEEKMAILTVFNQGPAISQADQESLFEVFQRTDSARSGTAKGWGLGLTLVKGLTEALQGQVRVESEEGRGTTFTIELPISNSG